MWQPTTLVALVVAVNLVRPQEFGYLPEYGQLPWPELIHDYTRFTTPLSPFANGSDVTMPPKSATPDFRLPEPPFYAYAYNFYKEHNRPYRISPHMYQVYKFNSKAFYEYVGELGCYCCAVFKRLTPLSTCAVITTRHALTTATATETVLRRYKKKKTLENILGFWYDNDAYNKNSSLYMSVARIHYHPMYNRPDRTNRSHPLPCVHDLSVWATTYRVQGWGRLNEISAVLCTRGVSNWWRYGVSTPEPWDLLQMVGFQFIWYWNRKPSPFFKYMIKTRLGMLSRRPKEVCPKTEWGWFHCIHGEWAKLGMDSGAALHKTHEGYTWHQDGLIGMNAFSMRLRSDQIIHYFHVIDNHPNVDFFYSAYMGRLPYEYLDHRFYDTQWKAPIIKPWFWIRWAYDEGYQPLYAPPFW